MFFSQNIHVVSKEEKFASWSVSNSQVGWGMGDNQLNTRDSGPSLVLSKQRHLL